MNSKVEMNFNRDKQCNSLDSNERYEDLITNSYYTKINFLSYIKSVISFSSIEIQRKQLRDSKRELCTLNIVDEEYKEERINSISDEEIDFTEQYLTKSITDKLSFQDILLDEFVLQAIEGLTERQKEILYKNIVLQVPEKELAKSLNVSKQSINKVKNKALENIRNKCKAVN